MWHVQFAWRRKDGTIVERATYLSAREVVIDAEDLNRQLDIS